MGCDLTPEVQNRHWKLIIRTMQGPAISVGPFACSETLMNPIPLVAAILVKTVLEWWLED